MPSSTPPTWHHGALPLDAERTRFALWAPDARYVSVELENGQSLPMLPQPEGWFVIQARCPAGSRYRFNIDDQLQVADPASRAQHGGVHGTSLVLDQQAYRWQHPHWCGRPWHEAVIYELHVGVMGGYGAVAQALPALVELGVTAIELMPLAEFPGTRNWGYDGVLPYAPQASYGTPDELKALIDTAHSLGLAVILDVVYNHFGPDGNYLQRYAHGFFRDDRHTPWGAAIDFRRRPVRDFFIDNALMWLLDYRFDGLRLDAVHAIDDPDFLQELAHRIREATPTGRHIWLTLENERNQASLLRQGFDGQWNDDAHNALHVLLTGEQEAYYADFAQQPTEQLARCLSQGFAFQGHTDRHGQARGEPSADLPPTAFVLFLQNHDQIGNRAFGERLNQLAPPQALHAATVLLLLSPMIPLLFMGDEAAAREPFLFFTSHQGELAEAVRQGRRSEFAAFSAFADAEQRQRIPDPNALETFQASCPRPCPQDAASTRALYRELLQLRHRELVWRLPGTRPLGTDVLAEGALSARWRLGDGCLLRIDINLSAHPVQVPQAPSVQPWFQYPPQPSGHWSQGSLPAFSVQVRLDLQSPSTTANGEHP
ncbi:malto-oligosyltrehalose trehalohydrolase [Pseudomonas sessilinigenes]|uniref:Malto-oligosyltrehalose trehalohydrolase n=1 Tax=Pseudomonas sessilinigenes TaxID=658629 RepID=A0ABX8MIQ3_9PSED|nr:malto-oligosyltrehalose trehalohydrolase [Pseudomonas sessilinigenes]AZC26841.1 Malto-oligosyltrehalose trehalohydrolase [Pseudomonas sessilinigenes]QXH39183.1 malto-oligosyltrehalose trehalohydrolase [Pseudomonas sessilinigenes]